MKNLLWELEEEKDEQKEAVKQVFFRSFEEVKQVINETGSDVPSTLIVGGTDGYQVYQAPPPVKELEILDSLGEMNAWWLIQVHQGWIPEEKTRDETKQENQDREVNVRNERLPGMIKALLGRLSFADDTGMVVYAVIKQKEGRYIVADTEAMLKLPHDFFRDI